MGIDIEGYNEILQQIVDGQINREGEKKAREEVKSAGIDLDDDNNVVGYEGDEAIERLKYEITGERGMGEKEPADEDEEEDRQEYYLSTMQDIVDEQKEFLGEKVAIKQARQAPLKIDAGGEIVDFYGKGMDALEILRSFTEHQKFYLEVIRRTIKAVENFFGQKVAYKYAMQAPLEIGPDNEVHAYYGKGLNALKVLIENYEGHMGESVANSQIRSAMEDLPEEDMGLLPERIRPAPRNGEEGGFMDNIRDLIGASMLLSRAPTAI